MKTIWAWHLNLKTASEANASGTTKTYTKTNGEKVKVRKSEHWTAKHKRHKKQKQMVHKVMVADKPNITLPCKVSLTRISPRSLDADDNLPMSLKWVKDAVADYIIPGKAPGRADDSKQITWQYDQRKGQPKETGVYIQIESDTYEDA